MLLSMEDAAYFERCLVKQKAKGAVERKMWLVHPHGTLIQEGADEWTAEVQERARPLLLQTMLLSGNSRSINEHLKALRSLIEGNEAALKSGRRAAYSVLLDQVLRRHPEERQRLRDSPAVELL